MERWYYQRSFCILLSHTLYNFAIFNPNSKHNITIAWQVFLQKS